MNRFRLDDWLSGMNVGAWGFLGLHAAGNALWWPWLAVDLAMFGLFAARSLGRWRGWL